ncbi:MAG TPA: hypothetical protein PKD17_15975, partial [Cellvibrionaceae bacterium]|nr:hypothetical protein [Cellvibrionaceae bacterium]
MNRLQNALTAALLFGLAGTAHAKTYTYELTNLNSSNSQIIYPGLDLNGAKSATFTVNRNGNELPEIRSFEITFPNAGKLRTGAFKRLEDGRYRALVSGAWVFKEVIIQLDGNSDFVTNSFAHIQIFVSETTSNLNPEALNQGPILATAGGVVRETTNLVTVDSTAIMIDGKRLSLNLKDRLGQSPDGPQGF